MLYNRLLILCLRFPDKVNSFRVWAVWNEAPSVNVGEIELVGMD